MRKFYLLLFGLMIGLGLMAQPPKKINLHKARKVVILNETFDSEIPSTWTILKLGDDNNAWEWKSSEQSAYHKYQYANCDDYLVTPALNLPSATGIKLQFSQKNDYPNDYELHQVLVLDSIAADTVRVIDTLYEGVASTSWENLEFSLDDYAGQTIYIAFRYVGNNADSWYVDNVNVFQQDQYDIVLDAILLPSYIQSGQAYQIPVQVHNTGYDTVDTFNMVYYVNDIAIDTVQYTNLAPDTNVIINSSYWYPMANDVYHLSARALFDADGDTSNNFITKAIHAVDTIIYVNNDTTLTVCKGFIFDDGGPDENYSNSADYTVTIVSTDPAKMPMITFDTVAIETNFDHLYVYNSDTIDNDALLADLTGYFSDTIVKALNVERAITLNLVSDGSVNKAGFIGEIGCYPVPLYDLAITEIDAPQVVITNDTVVTSFTVTNYGINPIDSFYVVYSVDTLVDSIFIADELPFDSTITLTDSNWIPLSPGQYQITVQAISNLDTVLQNNTLTQIVTVTDTLINVDSVETVSVCDAYIFDDGGPDGNYSNNANYVLTIISPDPGKMPYLEFDTIAMEENYDYIYIYNADTVDENALIAAITGYTSGVFVKALNESHAITIKLKSDGSVNKAGFAAHAGCYTPPQHDLAIIDAQPHNAFFKYNNSELRPKVLVANNSINTYNQVTIQVDNGAFYNLTYTVDTTLIPGAEVWVELPAWEPSAADTFVFNYQVIDSDDEVPENNTFTDTVVVLPYEFFNKFEVDNNHLAGIGTDNQNVYLVDWYYNKTLTYTLNGDSLYSGSFPTGIRDLAYDGNHFYGSNASTRLFVMDTTENHLDIVDTITVSGITVRGIAYDYVDTTFWANNWGQPLKELDSLGNPTGNTIYLDSAGIEGDAYGIAFVKIGDAKYIWLNNYDNPAIQEINLETGTYTGNHITFDAVPGLTNDVVPGGLDAYIDSLGNTHLLSAVNTLDNGTVVDIIINKPAYDVRFYAYGNDNPLQGATIYIIQDTSNIELTTDSLGMATASLPAGHYQAYATYESHTADTVEFDVPNTLAVRFDFTWPTDVVKQPNIKIAPNPTTGRFVIYNAKGYKATITDLSGHTVYTRNITGDYERVNLDLPGGVYIVRMTNGKHSVAYKLIIN